MDYYIFSKNSCAFKINGEYQGKADSNLKKVSCDLQNPTFEFLPFNQTLSPLCFNFLAMSETKLQNLQSYQFKNGFLLLPIFESKPVLNYSVFFSDSFGDCFVSVYLDAFYKIFIKSGEQSQIFKIDFLVEKAQVKRVENLLFVLLFNSKEKLLLIFKLSPNPTLVLKELNFELSFNQTFFSLSCQTETITGLKIFEKFDYNFNLLTQNFERSAPIGSLSPLLIHLAFLEEVSLCAPFKEFLHPKLLKHEGIIKNFLGDFYTFIPFLSTSENQAVILEKDAKILTFLIEDNLICDLFFE